MRCTVYFTVTERGYLMSVVSKKGKRNGIDDLVERLIDDLKVNRPSQNSLPQKNKVSVTDQIKVSK